MKQIEVDIDVFAAIWALRKPTESTENAVLRRLLLREPRDEPLADAESPPAQAALSSATPALEKTSVPIFSSGTPEREAPMGKVRWVDDVRLALRDLGGRASLQTIYGKVQKQRRSGNRSVPRTLEAVIRRTLEDHSSDSANFKGEDIFALLGRGEWGLRPQVK